MIDDSKLSKGNDISNNSKNNVQSIPYKRIATNYYKVIQKPNLSGDVVPILTMWNMETIKHDHGKDYLSKVPKFDGFCFIPEHLNYKEEISNFLNKYQPIPYQPLKGECTSALAFIKHVFGDQYELGLDYLTILYKYPTQRLPILCLVSKERNTGKSTFLMFLKAIFGANMTINTNEDFRSQFNSDWSHKLIIGVDEVLLDKKEDSERIKNLSTARSYKAEAKGQDRIEVEFIGKFVLCSNNEDNFIVIDPLETRYWVRKIDPFKSENENLLEELKEEIPHLLYSLFNRAISTEKKTRMWFTPEQIRTTALGKVKSQFRNRAEMELWETIKEIFETKELDEYSLTNTNAKILLERSGIKLGRAAIRKILEESWQLKQSANSLSYKTYVFDSTGFLIELTDVGRYYKIKKEEMIKIFDELMR